MYLEQETFLNVIDKTPLVSIDLVIHNPKQQVLLGFRNNRPARGFWFVPGGRIIKNETIEQAFLRILENETGLQLPFAQARLLGAYDHIYDDNFAGVQNINTHYVVLGFQLKGVDRAGIKTDSQHSRYKWMDINDLLQDGNVHQNTKNYFV
jgi:colanic acid biosynthesis protein WcaH